MSTKTTIKRIALVAVSALGFGLLSAIPSMAAPSATPWKVIAAQTSAGNLTATTTATQIVGANNYVEIEADDDYDTADTVTLLKVSGSTISSFNGVPATNDPVLNAAKTELVFPNDNAGTLAEEIDGVTVQISAASAGTITVGYYERTVVNGVPTDTLEQTITITVSAVKTWSPAESTAVIAKNGALATVAGSGETDILAPKGTLNAAADKVATITFDFEDSAGNNLSTPTGEYPTLRAALTAGSPGNLKFGAQAGTGRDITLATPAQAPTVEVYNDGTNGVATIELYVAGTLWKTKTVSFYGAASSLVASQGLYVANAAGGAFGCGDTAANCDGTTVAKTAAAQITATDNKGVKVPFLTLTATSSDTAVFSSSVTVAETVATGSGVYNSNVNVVTPGYTPVVTGKKATYTWTNGTVSTAAISYATGGAMSAVTFTVAAGERTGQNGTMAVALTDAGGNKPYDAVYALSLKSNLAFTAALYPATAITVNQAGASTNYMVLNGSGTWDFFNPLVEGSVSLAGSTFGGLAITASWVVTNTSQDAVDAANDAVEAANAATDAANAAAEAADAATAAAQDAQAAVADLAAQVATLISGIKAQITRLTNLVIKIQKKVKA